MRKLLCLILAIITATMLIGCERTPSTSDNPPEDPIKDYDEVINGTQPNNPPEDNPPADNPPEDNPPADNPPEDNPPADNPPEDNPPADNPPEDNPPADNPPEDNPPADNPPEDNPPIDVPDQSQVPTGFIVKQKKYNYQDNNVMILNVENQSNENHTICITGFYLDVNGNVIQSETKTFYGFASGFQNHFIFVPNIVFDKFVFALETTPYNETAFVNYLDVKFIGLELSRARDNFFTNESYPDWMITIDAAYQTANLYNKKLYIAADFVVFDNTGEIYFLDNNLREKGISPLTSDKKPSESCTVRTMEYTNFLWADKNKFTLPEKLTGEITGIIAIKAVSDKILVDTIE